MTFTARLPGELLRRVWVPRVTSCPRSARMLGGWFAELRSIELATWRERAALVLLLFVLCIHWLAALQPEYSRADGMAMHLAVPTNIAAHHVMTFRPDMFVWSVIGGHFTYSVVASWAARRRRACSRFTLLVMIVALLYRAAPTVAAARRGYVDRRALRQHASGPPGHGIAVHRDFRRRISRHGDELWRFHDTGERRHLWFAAALGGTAASAKLGACASQRLQYAAVGTTPPRAPAGAAGGGRVAAGVRCAALSHCLCRDRQSRFSQQPLPFLAAEHGAEFKNNQFKQPLSWNVPFDLTFHTGLYIEGLKGAFRFQYLCWSPLAAIASPAIMARASRRSWH